MIPGRFDMEVWKGGTFNTTLTARDRKSGSSTDFTKYTNMRLVVRPLWDNPYLDDDTPLLELTMANGGIVRSGDGLSLDLTAPASATEALTFTDARYILELILEEVDVEAIIDPFLYGKFTVLTEGSLG